MIDQLNLANETTNSSFHKNKTDQQIFDTNYNCILDLVREFKTNTLKTIEKRHVQSALEIILWPSNQDVWQNAEAICMAKVKSILENMFSESPTAELGLKECLQAILYLGEKQSSPE